MCAYSVKTSFSFIIPSRNEIQDISVCINSVLNIKHAEDELIVIDDSSDGTYEFVKNNFEDQLFIFRGPGRGLNSAYNMGILHSKNSVLVLLTADNILPSDFRSKLLNHYNSGSVSVVCRSQCTNIKDYSGLYFRLIEDYKYDILKDYLPSWSEGFSCLRDVAIHSGLLDESNFVVGGTDNLFAEKIKKFKRSVYDKSIIVNHIQPNDLKVFATQMFNRGVASVQLLKLRGINFHSKYTFIRILSGLLYITKGLCIIPSIILSLKICRGYRINIYLKFILVDIFVSLLIGFGILSEICKYR